LSGAPDLMRKNKSKGATSMKIIIETQEKAAQMAAERYEALLRDKPEAVLGFDRDSALKPLFSALAGRADLAGTKIFAVSELCGEAGKSDGSAHAFIEKELAVPFGIAGENIHFPCTCQDAGEEELKKYDADIEAAGGMDLLALGIGHNGRIGYNEPATPFESFTHSQLLTDSTRGHLASSFGSEDAVPERGVTMGIKTIMAARAVIMFACGEDKADIIHKMVYGKTVTFVPASMLQLHLDMTLYLDEAAASKLD
jgi:glucosamine-6-phosphate deaminase